MHSRSGIAVSVRLATLRRESSTPGLSRAKLRDTVPVSGRHPAGLRDRSARRIDCVELTLSRLMTRRKRERSSCSLMKSSGPFARFPPSSTMSGFIGHFPSHVREVELERKTHFARLCERNMVQGSGLRAGPFPCTRQRSWHSRTDPDRGLNRSGCLADSCPTRRFAGCFRPTRSWGLLSSSYPEVSLSIAADHGRRPSTVTPVFRRHGHAADTTSSRRVNTAARVTPWMVMSPYRSGSLCPSAGESSPTPGNDRPGVDDCVARHPSGRRKRQPRTSACRGLGDH